MKNKPWTLFVLLKHVVSGCKTVALESPTCAVESMNCINMGVYVTCVRQGVGLIVEVLLPLTFWVCLVADKSNGFVRLHEYK
jgi:hypothetical protein